MASLSSPPMTTLRQLRKTADGLPEVAETTHFGMVAFEVRGRGFASLTDDGLLQLQMSDGDAEAAVDEFATGERLVRMGTPIGFRVPLADVNGQQLHRLMYLAWDHRAPKKLAASLRDARAGVRPAGCDLPTEIGKPATRALLSAGVFTMDDVAERSEASLAALHGVGPKALRILEQTLAETGRSFVT